MPSAARLSIAPGAAPAPAGVPRQEATPARACDDEEEYSLRQHRVHFIARVMRRVGFGWDRELRLKIGRRWGVTDQYVRRLAAQASREVFAEVQDPEVVARNLATMATQGIVEATRNGQSRSVERYANVLMKAVGIGQRTTTNQQVVTSYHATQVQVVTASDGEQLMADPSIKSMFRGISPAPELAEPAKPSAR